MCCAVCLLAAAQETQGPSRRPETLRCLYQHMPCNFVPACTVLVSLQRRRRRKDLVGGLNVLLYIKQQQARFCLCISTCLVTLCLPVILQTVCLQRRRRRKGLVGDLNVALYIKQQQARGSTRKWRQQWCVTSLLTTSK
jgi:hypothetical protein